MKRGEQPVTEVQLVGVKEEWPEINEHEWQLLPSINQSWLSVALKLKPNPELAANLDGVYLLVSEIKFFANSNGTIIREETKSLGNQRMEPFILSRQNKYQNSQLPVSFAVNHCRDVSARVELVFLKRTLSVISEVRLPPSSTLGEELGKLLTFTTQEENSTFTDVKITITSKNEGGETSSLHVFAHKAILAARSPVFAKMFEHSLRETATNCVTVSDIDPEVFKELLTHVYTDRSPNLNKCAVSLLYAAEKYQLERLKSLCEQNLSYRLQVDNAAEMLVLSQTYGAKQLKRNALKYILEHRNEVRKTKGWEKVQQRCDLLEELLDTALPAKK